MIKACVLRGDSRVFAWADVNAGIGRIDSPAGDTAIVKYDSEFAMEQVMRKSKLGTVVLYHHTNLKGYLGIRKSNRLFGSSSSLSGDFIMINSFVYLTDISKILTVKDVNALFMRLPADDIGVDFTVPKTLADLAHTITLRVPVYCVERLPTEFVPRRIMIYPGPRSRATLELAPHIYRIPCAPEGIHIEPSFGRDCYNIVKVEGFRTPRIPPDISSGYEFGNLAFYDIYP